MNTKNDDNDNPINQVVDFEVRQEAEKLNKLQRTGSRFVPIDRHLVEVIKKRQILATQVSDIKMGAPIVVPEREHERLDAIGVFAKEQGVDSVLMKTILSLVIHGSVKHQAALRDQMFLGNSSINRFDTSFNALRQNLLLLTAQVAHLYDEMQIKCPTTQITNIFEDKIIASQIIELPSMGTLLGLGCATGSMEFRNARRFRKIIGYDISQDMINIANNNKKKQQSDRFTFSVQDLEHSLHNEDESVSMVIMNNGTCSDIDNIEQLLSEINRILVKGGRAFLSFYNINAVVHKSRLPWQSSVPASFNPVFETLDVDAPDIRGSIPIFARPYNLEQVLSLVGKYMNVSKFNTFPCISSVLSRDVLENGNCEGLIEADYLLAESGDEQGAYISIVASKK